MIDRKNKSNCGGQMVMENKNYIICISRLTLFLCPKKQIRPNWLSVKNQFESVFEQLNWFRSQSVRFLQLYNYVLILSSALFLSIFSQWSKLLFSGKWCPDIYEGHKLYSITYFTRIGSKSKTKYDIKSFLHKIFKEINFFHINI